MYHSITPVTEDHNPIIVEGEIETQIILFNAGPSPIEASVWQQWEGKKNGNYIENANEPNLKLELRAGSQKIISGSFIRIGIKNSKNINSTDKKFAAVGTRIILKSQIIL